MSDKTKGILLLLVAAFGFSMMAAFVKLAGDVPTIEKAFFRNLASMVVSFFVVIYHRERLFGHKANQKVLLLRAICGTFSILTFFYTIDHLILSDADMLNKLSPFLTILFAALFLNERTQKFQVVSIIIAFIGALFIIKPSFSVSIIPYAAGLLSSLFSAGAQIFLRMLGNKEKYYTVVFYFSFISTIMLFPFVIIFYHPMSWLQLIYLVLAGVFATIGQFGLTLAYKFAPARDISIFFYSTVLYSTIFSILLFHQTPDPWSITGYVIIMGALLYMFLKNRRETITLKTGVRNSTRFYS